MCDGMGKSTTTLDCRWLAMSAWWSKIAIPQFYEFFDIKQKRKYAPKNIRQKWRQDGISVIVWGYFIGNKLGPIIFIDGTVKKEVYIGMLEEYFLPFLNTVYTDDPAPCIFQQDNARPHIAKMTHDWFKPLAPYGMAA